VRPRSRGLDRLDGTEGWALFCTLALILRKRGCLSLANDAGIMSREFQASLMLLGALGGLG